MKFTSLLLAAGLVAAVPAMAQSDFPSRPIRIIVPFSAGGIVDSVARVIGDKERPVIVYSPRSCPVPTLSEIR